MAENKDKVKLEDTFSADEAAVKTTSENKDPKATNKNCTPTTPFRKGVRLFESISMM